MTDTKRSNEVPRIQGLSDIADLSLDAKPIPDDSPRNCTPCRPSVDRLIAIRIKAHQQSALELQALLDALPRRLPPLADEALYTLLNEGRRTRGF